MNIILNIISISYYMSLKSHDKILIPINKTMRNIILVIDIYLTNVTCLLIQIIFLVHVIGCMRHDTSHKNIIRVARYISFDRCSRISSIGQ